MSVVSFHPQGMLPERIDRALLMGNWPALEKEVRAGFPVNAQAYGGTSLFEMVLSAAEIHFKGPATLPMSLLDAMIEGGLARGELVEGSGLTAVALCAEYAQWAWMGRLLERDFQRDTPQWPSIFLLAVGRAERFRADIDELLEKHQENQANPHSAQSPPVGSPAQARPESSNVYAFPSSPASPVQAEEPIQTGVSIQDAVDRRNGEVPAMIAGLDCLLAAGADINAVPTSHQESAVTPPGAIVGAHALMEALRDRDHALVIALAARSADVASLRLAWPDSPKTALATPLIYSLTSPDVPTTQALLAAGAPMVAGDLIDQDILDRCALSHPYSSHHPLRECVFMADGVDRSAVVGLLATRLDEADRDEQLGLAFQQAAALDRVDYMEILFQAGASMTHRTTGNGFMAIHQACSSGAVAAIEYLLVHGVKLADTSNGGVSAASLLAKHPHLLDRFDAKADMGNIRFLRPR